MAFNSDYGPTYLDLVFGEYKTALREYDNSLKQNLAIDLEIRCSDDDNGAKITGWKRYIIILEWLLALRFLQAIVNRLFLRKSDLEPKQPKNIIPFLLRSGLHALLSLPLSIVNFAVHTVFCLFSPKMFWRALKRNSVRKRWLLEKYDRCVIPRHNHISKSSLKRLGDIYIYRWHAYNEAFMEFICSQSNAKLTAFCKYIIERGSPIDRSTDFNKFPREVRTEICTTIIPTGEYAGHTSLSFQLIHNDYQISDTLIADLSADQRARICTTRLTAPEYKNATALSLSLQQRAVTAYGYTSYQCNGSGELFVVNLVANLSSAQLKVICLQGVTIKNTDGQQIDYCSNFLYALEQDKTIAAAALLVGTSAADRTSICCTFDEHFTSETPLIWALSNGINHGILTSLLKNLTPDQLYKICTTYKKFEDGTRGMTALEAAVVNGNTKIALALIESFDVMQRNDLCALTFAADDSRAVHNLAFEYGLIRVGGALIDGLPMALRFNLCKQIFKEGKTAGHTALSYAILYNDLDTVAALIAGFTLEQLDELMAIEITIVANNKTTTNKLLAYCAVYNAFQADPLLNYATQRKLDVEAVCLAAFDSEFRSNISVLDDDDNNVDDTIRGLGLAVLNGVPPTVISVEKRKQYLLSATKPLATDLILMARRSAQSNNLFAYYLTYIAAWLEDFTLEEQRAALTPADIEVTDENPLLITAYEHGLVPLTTWLVGYGFRAPAWLMQEDDGPQGGVDYAQSIHNEAVHNTVAQSLDALIEAQFITDTYVFSALQKWKQFAGNPDPKNNVDTEQVAKRALLRIINSKLINVPEGRSGVRVSQILAYLWFYLEKITQPEDRANALAKIYLHLKICQRDYNDNCHQRDRPICYGGTINQLTMALQAVCPKHVLVVFENDKSLAVKGLNLLPNLINMAFKQAKNRAEFVAASKRVEAEIIPLGLWPLLEADLRAALEQQFHLTMPDGTKRLSVSDPDLRNQLIDLAITIIKGVPEYREAQAPIARINQIIPAIPTAAATKLGNNKIISPISWVRFKDKITNKYALIVYGVDAAKKSTSSATIYAPYYQQNLNSNYTDAELAVKYAVLPDAATECSEYISQTAVELDEALLNKQQLRTYKIDQLTHKIAAYQEFCKDAAAFTPAALQTFSALAQDQHLMRHLLSLFDPAKPNNIWVYDALYLYATGNLWLQSYDTVMSAIGAAEPPVEFNHEAVGDYLFAHSAVFYKALLFQYVPVMQEQLVEMQQVDVARRARLSAMNK